MNRFAIQRALRAALHQHAAQDVERRGVDLRALVRTLLQRVGGAALPSGEAAQMAEDLVHEVQAYGPLWPYVLDPEVSEIMVNGPSKVFIEREGHKQRAEARFRDEAHLHTTVDRIAGLDPGHRLDASKPMVDLSLPDGSRANAVLSPIAHGGTHLTIRCYQGRFRDLGDLVELGTLDTRMADLLDAAVRGRLNILFSGGTATGKTTLLELLSRSIPEAERVIVIEDTLELHLIHDDVVRLLTREHNIEGRGAITIGDLFRNALRMAPDRVLLGEIRGAEAYDLLQALNSGHQGSLAILHASSPEEAVVRLQNLVPLAGLGVPPDVVRRQISHGLDLIVQMHQLADGSRRVTRITEVRDLGPDGHPELVDLLLADVRIVDTGAVEVRFDATGAVPRALDRLRQVRPDLPPDLFEPGARAAGPRGAGQ